MELEYVVSSSSKNEQNTALVLKDNAQKVGIEVNIVRKAFVVKNEQLKQHNFELAALGSISAPIPFDPYQSWHTESYSQHGSNYGGFGNADSDALIEKIRTTIDDKERAALYLRFQEMVYEEQPAIFLFYMSNPMAISKRFETKPSNLRPGYFSNQFILKVDAKQ